MLSNASKRVLSPLNHSIALKQDLEKSAKNSSDTSSVPSPRALANAAFIVLSPVDLLAVYKSSAVRLPILKSLLT